MQLLRVKRKIQGMHKVGEGGGEGERGYNYEGRREGRSILVVFGRLSNHLSNDVMPLHNVLTLTAYR